MITLPAAIAFTTPVCALIVAKLGLGEVHTPPVMLFVRVIEDPTQTPLFPPAIRPGLGIGLMTTAAAVSAPQHTPSSALK